MSTNDASRPSKSCRGRLVFRLGAVSNWIVTLPAILFAADCAKMIGIPDAPESTLFLLRIWAGMAFLWGIYFWDISGDLRGRRHMIKYAWLEKCVTTAAVFYAFFGPEGGSWRTFAMILYTDVLWIPLFLYYDWKYRGGAEPADAFDEAAAALGPPGAPA